MQVLRAFIKRNQGQAMVEMALVLPILILLLFGIIEFGRIMGSYMVINNLAREGVRYGVVGHDDDQIRQLVMDDHTWLNENELNVTVTPDYADRVKGESLQVQVSYDIDLITPFFNIMLPNPLPINAQCSMRVE